MSGRGERSPRAARARRQGHLACRPPAVRRACDVRVRVGAARGSPRPASVSAAARPPDRHDCRSHSSRLIQASANVRPARPPRDRRERAQTSRSRCISWRSVARRPPDRLPLPRRVHLRRARGSRALGGAWRRGFPLLAFRGFGAQGMPRCSAAAARVGHHFRTARLAREARTAGRRRQKLRCALSVTRARVRVVPVTWSGRTRCRTRRSRLVRPAFGGAPPSLRPLPIPPRHVTPLVVDLARNAVMRPCCLGPILVVALVSPHHQRRGRRHADPGADAVVRAKLSVAATF